MDNNFAASYGEGCAEFYDEIYGAVNPNVIHVLTELTRGGRALELGIGTGRVALRLASNGVDISGIEASSSMLERLKAKPNGANIPVHLGNFADTKIEGEYTLIFALVNTFSLLSSREEQQRSLKNIASHLTQDGYFLAEFFDSSNEKNTDEETKYIHAINHTIMTGSGLKTYSVSLCPVDIETMDLMAKNAGLKPLARWRNWRCEPYTQRDGTHISVYGRDSLV